MPPLTAKGEKIKAALTKEYGAKKGEQVLYAGRNKGTFTGIDAARSPAARDMLNRAISAGAQETQAQRQARALLGSSAYVSGRDLAARKR